jgi:hypothetical protein
LLPLLLLLSLFSFNFTIINTTNNTINTSVGLSAW